MTNHLARTYTHNLENCSSSLSLSSRTDNSRTRDLSENKPCAKLWFYLFIDRTASPRPQCLHDFMSFILVAISRYCEINASDDMPPVLLGPGQRQAFTDKQLNTSNGSRFQQSRILDAKLCNEYVLCSFSCDWNVVSLSGLAFASELIGCAYCSMASAVWKARRARSIVQNALDLFCFLPVCSLWCVFDAMLMIGILVFRRDVPFIHVFEIKSQSENACIRLKRFDCDSVWLTRYKCRMSTPSGNSACIVCGSLRSFR